jgi:hypothetical protein
MNKWPSVNEALESADILEKVIGENGIWIDEEDKGHDEMQHAKLINHHMRCLIVLARKMKEITNE